MRKLASIQKIANLTPILGADKVVMAQVLGYEVVVGKDEFKIGDLGVYFECDSILPEKPEFEFLRKVNFRIKIRRFKGQYSMGLMMPLSILPKDLKVSEGMEVTEILGVQNYVKLQENKDESNLIDKKKRSPIMRVLMGNSVFRKIYLSLNTQSHGNWPDWIQKTDETRLASETKILLDHFDEPWYITEKLDGSSTTFFNHKVKRWGFNIHQYGVCSRNVHLKTPDNSAYWQLARKYQISKIHPDKEWIIQGECIGPKIQKNKYQLSDYDFYVFNWMVDLNHSGLTKLGSTMMDLFCQQNGLKMVPLLHKHFIPSTVIQTKEIKDVVRFMTDLSKGYSQISPTLREGIVCRLHSNPNISFKVINPDFLMEQE